MTPRKHPYTPTVSAPDSSNSLDAHLSDSSFWDAVDNSPEISAVLNSPKKAHRARERRDSRSSNIDKSTSRDTRPRPKPGQRNILARNPSPPVLVTKSVEIQMPSFSFPDNRVEEHFDSAPLTPKRPRVLQDPPSTGSTTALVKALNNIGLYTPSKRDQRRAPQPPPQARTSSRPQKKTIFIDLDADDEEEEEVSKILTEPESAPPTRPSSLYGDIFSPNTRSAVTSATSFSGSGRQGQGSLSSSGEGSGTRKHPRDSDGSVIEVRPLNPLTKPNSPVDASSPKAKVRKASPEDRPTKPVPQTNPLVFSLTPDAPPSVSSFFRQELGTDLCPILISHDEKAQQRMDELGLAWGVQYELARGVTLEKWTWGTVLRILDEKPMELKGRNAQAAFKVRAVMMDREIPHGANILLWEELDREQDAISENKGRGLGLMGTWDGQDNWYGGRIQQVARLSRREDGSGYHLRLEAMEKRRSLRFARFCGSRRILQLRMPEELILNENDKLKSSLLGRFILCGRVFVPFHAKGHSLYIVETNEDWERQPRAEFGDQHRIPFGDFINWHNPPEYNHKQALSKYVTRYALGLSTTVPVLEFKEEEMHLIDDIYGIEYKGGKASAEETMTDGCGLINQAALLAINNMHLNKQSLPVALQGRIAGAKGLWLLHPTDNSPEPTIWIRDSQNKIKYPRLDRAHRIFELVAPSHPSYTVAVTRQSIVNLSFNGVPDEVLMAYLEKGITEEIEPLVKWDHPKASSHLWFAINAAGNVTKSRLGRATAGISRALGLTRRMWKEDDDEGEVVDFDEDKSTDTGRNKYSGAPLGLHESALELVQAGFHPSSCKPLRDKLEYIIQHAIKSYVEKYRIPLPESLEGFVVPDPLGILEEGEIYYRASQSLLNPRTQQTFDVLTGDVILGRYPIRLASDLQKVKAVDKRELYPWPDVVIASTKGSRSLASLLSGGDMDGDELFVLREPEVVEPFENKTFVPGPPDLLKNFEKHVESVPQFCERVKFQSPEDAQAALQGALLLSLEGDRKGMYSVFHDNAVEKYGYDHPESIRLAYMFNTLLDASKSGLILAEGIYERDQKKYGNFRDSYEDSFFGDPESSEKKLTRPINRDSHAYILTKIEETARAKGAELMVKFNNASNSCSDNGMRDPELTKPYKDATEYANRMFLECKFTQFRDEMTLIRKHVDMVHNEWLIETRNATRSKQKSKSKRGASSANTDVSKKAAMLFASPIEGVEAIQNVKEVLASFAHDGYPLSPFAFQVAFRQLCEIKARATRGGIAPCITEIDEMKTIPASSIRAMEKSYVD